MQLMAEASSMSQAGLHAAAGLGLQASMGSLWQEGSTVGLSSGGGQMLPPLMGHKGSGGGASGVLHSARRSSHMSNQVRIV